MHPAISFRIRVFRETLWNRVVWAINGIYGVLALLLFIRDNFLPDKAKQKLQLLDLFHKLNLWQWIALIIATNFVLLFEGAARAIEGQEENKRALNDTLRNLTRGLPHIRPVEPDAAESEITYFNAANTTQFNALFIRVRFVNDPSSAAPSATANNIGARIRYYADDQSTPALEQDGRWADSTQPSVRDPRQAIHDLPRIDFHIGQEHLLDVGFRDPSTGDFFAWNNDSYTIGFQHPRFRITADQLRVEIRIRGENVDETYELRIQVHPRFQVIEQPYRKTPLP